MNLIETKLRSEAVYDGNLLHIRRDEVRLPNGVVSVREYNCHIGAVCIVPLTDDGRVLLEHQFRYATGEVITELPAGKLDAPDEDPLAAAQRELREETGAAAEKWIPLGVFYPAVAYSTEIIHMYAAVGLTFGETEMDEDEFLETELVPLDAAVDAVLAGNIPDSKTQAGILRAALMRERGQL